MKIYVASSWRNDLQPFVVNALRTAGHEVYDFKNPKPGEHGFSWSEIDSNWRNWTDAKFSNALNHPISERGFRLDFDGMKWADACVMVMPCGRSAHIEAGWCAGAGKRLVIMLSGPCEPELMYKLTPFICRNMSEVLEALAA